ncbi:hypothetical protein [Chloroflexus islandicus]|uniref:hypothetical protein n=1 Tax=Chloroflexus islandicus TaxID=1707952 RepID=UPI000A43376E|nr:hypothetical protein [Chloroflexus islandicus]
MIAITAASSRPVSSLRLWQGLLWGLPPSLRMDDRRIHIDIPPAMAQLRHPLPAPHWKTG